MMTVTVITSRKLAEVGLNTQRERMGNLEDGSAVAREDRHGTENNLLLRLFMSSIRTEYHPLTFTHPPFM
jgi:hypothetical protein